MTRIAVYLETGSRKTFASAVEWPGWSRGGRSEDTALDALLGHAPRYAGAIAAARAGFASPGSREDLEVVERVRGGSGTDFGVPGEAASGDDRPLADDELERLRRILLAVWDTFDEAARRAAGVELRKGPRGGGRDVEKIRRHVLGAEAAYVTSLGGRPPAGAADAADVAAGMDAVRAAAVETLLARGSNRPVPKPSGTRSPWSARYYVRRAAWHALDHAWEIEDRSAPQGPR